MGEDRDGAAGEVGELVAVVDAEVVVDRGEQVLRVERAFGGVFGFGVGGSDDLGSGIRSLAKEIGHSRFRVVLCKGAEVLAEVGSSIWITQELVQRGSQRLRDGHGLFDHESGGVVGEQTGIEPLMIVSRGRQRDENRRQTGTRQLRQRRRTGS